MQRLGCAIRRDQSRENQRTGCGPAIASMQTKEKGRREEKVETLGVRHNNVSE
jgi:hypothetical protein